MKKTCNNCAGCAHYRRLADHGGNDLHVCHYILDTGHMRGCPVSACTINTRATRRTTKGAAA